MYIVLFPEVFPGASNLDKHWKIYIYIVIIYMYIINYPLIFSGMDEFPKVLPGTYHLDILFKQI